MDKKQINEWSKMNSKFDFNEKFVRQNMKKENKGFQYLLRGCAVLGMCLLVLVSTNPNVIKAMKGSPFFGDIIEWFGLASYEQALENDYIQRIDLTKEENGVTLSVHDLAIDEQNMYLHYTVNFGTVEHYGYDLNIKHNDITLFAAEHTSSESIDEMILSCNQLNGMDIDNITMELIYNQNRMEMEIGIDQTKIAKARVEELHQKFTVKGQKFVVEKVEFYPLATHIYVNVDNSNELEVVNFDFDVLVDGKKMEGHGDTWNYTKDGIVYVEASPYYETGKKEIVLNSVQLQPRKNDLSIGLQAKTVGGYIDHVELVEFLSRDNGDVLSSRFSRIVPDYVDYIVLLQVKDTTNHRLGTVTADSGVNPSFGESYGDMIEIMIDKECLDNVWMTPVKLNFGETVEVNEKLKLK
ncbi:MAG: DUF4179 domain-containing protein [Erysipelotrichaceae bacterium]|nr:DUF4179 domain-containing protein [Erysipelotrichaceae bacterium]